MNSNYTTEIIVDNDVPMLRMVREFDATLAQVFLAHTDPTLVAQWNGPNGTDMQVTHWDCRNGGSYSYRHIIEGETYEFRGCFHDVRPNEMIVQTFTFEGMPDGVALEKLTLEDLGNGRTRLTATSLVDSFADRDAMVSSGMEHGIREGYERLDTVLTTLS